MRRHHRSRILLTHFRTTSVLALLLTLAGGCVSKPRLDGTNLAPPRLRCDHDPDRECDEVLREYFSGRATFTCTGPGDRACNPQIVVPGRGYFDDRSLMTIFGEERGRAAGGPGERPYDLGVALAGGGTKAASYAMGILAGLYDPSNRGLSDRVDAISSVSGGTYAALWYFARLLDEYQITNEHEGRQLGSFTEVFADCLPISYAALAPTAESNGDPQLCPLTPTQLDPDPKKADRFRFQNHVRGFHDVFGKDFDLTTPVDKNDYGALKQGATELVFTLPILPAHWVANGLLDSETNLSLSGRRYFNGIAYTYGYRPVNCKALANPPHNDDDAWKQVCAKGRLSPNTQAARGHTMSALANLYYGEENSQVRGSYGSGLPRIPFWIANTTAGVSRGWFDFSSKTRPDFEDAVFEFTPYSFGSRHFGRWVGTPTNAELMKVAGASGAFLDGQQRTLDTFSNAAAWAGMRVLALNWGVSIPNPRWRDEVRLVHRMLPFPAYLFHHDSLTRDGAWIHLSDGGMSEDLGVWSLIRRGVGTMLIADESYDGEGRMEDICYLRKQLAARRMYLHVPELADLNGVCEDGQKSSDYRRYNLWQWRLKYLRGCITTDANAPDCKDTNPEYFARLLIFKPALDVDTLGVFLDRCPQNEIEKNGPSQSCRQAFEDLRQLDGYHDFPSELFGFLLRNRPASSNPNPGDFPQNSTKAMTLHSSATLYGAYRELARWQMRGIVDEVDGSAKERHDPIVPFVHAH